MTRYIETLFRHKVLLVMPLVLTLIVSVWYVSGQAKTYTTSTTVWFDTQGPGPSFFDTTGNTGTPPASQAQSLLTQLLATKDFLVKAAERGPAGDYIRAHPASQDAAAARLAAGVTSLPVGSQVLRVSLTDADAGAAPKELQAVVDQYFESVAAIRSARGQQSVDYYQPRLADAAKVKSQAEAQQVSYLQAHPEAGAVGSTDPTYAALVAAATTAQKDYTDLQGALTQAQQSLSTDQTAATSHVIDPPGDAIASSTKKKVIFAAGAAVFFGLFLGLLGLVGLTAADTAARRREDVEMASDDLRVVATISEFQRSRPADREASNQ